MQKIAVMLLKGEPITDGMDLGIDGYHHVKLVGKVIYGQAWVDVTKANAAKYQF
jgi:simple sugar transport system substrate-binding protein